MRRNVWRGVQIGLAALATSSLLLSFAASGIWILSYGRADLFRWASVVNDGTQAISKRTYIISGQGSIRWMDQEVFRGSADYHPELEMNEIPPMRGPKRPLGYVHIVTRWKDLTFNTTPFEKHLLGVRWWTGRSAGQVGGPPRQIVRCVVVPLWLIDSLLLLPPAIWAWRCNNRRNRPKAGHCAACGYNLTGNMTGVCPECGSDVGEVGKG